VTDMDPSFIVIPAVDIKGGRCVRLRRGLAEEETVFDEDPVRAALRWEEEGARLLHVVDLDGAFAGRPINGTVVKEIASALRIPVEVGGGIRDTRTAVDYVESGLERVVVGTAAFSEESWLSELVGALGERLAVGVDVKEGKVAVKGWTGVSTEEPVAAVKRLADAGVRRIIYTDTMKDGTLEGPNFEGLQTMAKAAAMPVIASGGVGSLGDIERIAELSGLGIEGVIVGMALYTGKLSLADAIDTLRGRDV
jgi:phosphoribosylformimino-5-aminoimidazole carboxamide ribotide isomerase